jgi:hypothetical protein
MLYFVFLLTINLLGPISANFKYSPEIGKVFAFHDSFVKFWNPIDGYYHIITRNNLIVNLLSIEN